MLMALLPLAMSAQDTKVLLPGNGNIDVEKFSDNINTGIDISKLSLQEVRVLKHAPEARQGVLLMDADLRQLYLKTSWYGNRMYDRYAAENWDKTMKVDPVKYTEAEKQFMKRLADREAELMKANFVTDDGRVNTSNIVNRFQMEDYNGALDAKLKKNGFAIVEDRFDQLFQVYEVNEYQQFPCFVTTDIYLQAFHIYFDSMLRRVENKVLSPRVMDFCKTMKSLMQKAKTNANAEIKDMAMWNEAYFAVAIALLEDKPLSTLANNKYAEMAKIEVDKVKKADPDNSEFLEYTDPNVPFTYNLFRPRGHYSRTEALQRYFRSMMWLQTVPFATDSPHQLKRAALIAETLQKNPAANKKLQQIVDPMTFIMGETDNVGIMQLQDLMKKHQVTLAQAVADESKCNLLKAKVEEMAKQTTRILPKHQITSKFKVNLMPQRYMPDAEVLQEMVDADSEVTKRGESKGLDYFAAMGCSPAEKVLIDELKEAQKWDKYEFNLDRMKQRMKEINWTSTVTNAWIDNLKDLLKNDPRYPYFMQSDEWNKKSLNTALASYAEMKHDAILYAKQPMIAEAGDGEDIEDPVLRGYVEPNVTFWTKALQVMDMTEKGFSKFGITDNSIKSITKRMKDLAKGYLDISKKELARQTLSKNDYDLIEATGPFYENLTLSMIQDDETEEIQSWYLVEGADKKVALVADVLTANGENNPNKSVVYEAVGPAYEIYVVAEIEGQLYLTRGAVFSYREFSREVFSDRLTDEEWQKNLKTNPTEGIPVWMNDIIIPRSEIPRTDDVYYYDDEETEEE